MGKLDMFRETLLTNDTWSNFFNLEDVKVLEGLMALSSVEIEPLNESLGKASERCPTCGK